MKLKEFNYSLPQEYIANYPPKIRGESNLLVINTKEKKFNISKYIELDKYIPQNSIVVLNNTKVVPARILIPPLEIFFLEKHTDVSEQFNVIAKGKIKIGREYILGKGVSVKIVGKKDERIFKVKFFLNRDGKQNVVKKYIELVNILEEIGHIPLPPYIKRKDELSDKDRYQTVFAKNMGSVAAPTASLNFTNELKTKLEKQNIMVEYLTLHCGLGTFKTIKTENIEEHKMDLEYYEMGESIVKQIGRKHFVAVGTTVTRSLENYSLTNQTFGEAGIFLYPGKKFNIVDSLVTNFHAPNTTPLMLTIAFVTNMIAKHKNIEINNQTLIEGRDFLFEAYEYAMRNNFKFLSYGDSCYII